MKALLSILSCVLLVACAGPSQSGSAATPQESRARIGVFDSRAVAVAYAASPQFRATLDALVAERDRAKAEGRTDRVRELEAEGAERQERLHEQGFGTGDVGELLALIRDELPAISEQAGVDLLVSKFDIVWKRADAQWVDVTDRIVEPFHPDAKTRERIAAVRKMEPVPLSELRRHHD